MNAEECRCFMMLHWQKASDEAPAVPGADGPVPCGKAQWRQSSARGVICSGIGIGISRILYLFNLIHTFVIFCRSFVMFHHVYFLLTFLVPHSLFSHLHGRLMCPNQIDTHSDWEMCWLGGSQLQFGIQWIDKTWKFYDRTIRYTSL